LPSVASVSSAGVVTAVAEGVAVVGATIEGVGAIARINVVPVSVAGVTITPRQVPTLSLGDSVQLSVSVIGTNGLVVTNFPISWSSTAPTVATVSAGGLIRAVGVGTAVVGLTVGGFTTLIAVVVTPPATQSEAGAAPRQIG
jgi:uncharacterized protein YjdB